MQQHLEEMCCVSYRDLKTGLISHADVKYAQISLHTTPRRDIFHNLITFAIFSFLIISPSQLYYIHVEFQILRGKRDLLF